MEKSELKYPDVPAEMVKETFLPMMIEWRDEYIDDLPDAILNPEDPVYKKFKCRNNWFTYFKGMLYIVVPYIDDPDLLREVEDYIFYLENEVDWYARRTKEDIDKANDILEKVIANMEKVLG